MRLIGNEFSKTGIYFSYRPSSKNYCPINGQKPPDSSAMRAAIQRMFIRWQLIFWLMLLLSALAVFIVHTFWPARFATTYGFPAYYTAGRLFATGQLGPNVYDDNWFGDRVEELTQNGVRGPLLF